MKRHDGNILLQSVSPYPGDTASALSATAKYKDTRLLASKCVTMVEAVLEGAQPEINDTTQYNNGVKVVPSYLCQPIAVDQANYESVIVDGGYYTKEQLKIQ